MNTITYYWKRFTSDTPKALKKLGIITGSISAACISIATTFSTIDHLTKVAGVLGIIGSVTGGIALGCKFATTDPNLQ